MLPVTQLFGQIDIQNMRKNVNKLSGIAEGCTNGVRWGNVIQLYIKKKEMKTFQPPTSQKYVNKYRTLYCIHYGFYYLGKLN